MSHRPFLAAAGFGLASLLLAACATDPAPAPASSGSPGEPAVSEPAAIAQSPYEMAMQTASRLSAQGNEQAAIDRLTQLLGDPGLSARQQADALHARAELRYGEGNDVFGAISDLDEMLAIDPDHPLASDAREMRDIARGEATSLNFLLEQGELSRTERFETLFRLGQHQEALDLMLSSDLDPGNDYLIDLYQMGYLCEGAELTGPSYAAVEPDGTERRLRYCEFGK